MPDATELRPRFEVVRDPSGGATVVLDGRPQSYVAPDDPLLLAFEYVQQLALVLDALPEGRLAVTHVGGAGLTLPRWVEATRPGSPQIVLEPDAELTAAVRRALPLPRGHRIRVRAVDGRTGLTDLADASADAIVVDAFADGRVPAELTTLEAVTAYARVLRPGGVLLLNVTDEPDRRYLARVLATVCHVLPHLVALTTGDVAKGRRFGNWVVAASAASLPVDGLRRAVASAPLPTTLLDDAALRGVSRSGRSLTDADGARSPAPPVPGRWRVR